MHGGSLYIGLMSGTSLDGVDAALVEFGSDGSHGGAPSPPHVKLRTVATYYAPFSPELRAEMAALQAPSENEVHRAALAANVLARAYASAVRAVLDKASLNPSSITAIGAHGQTVRHRPELGFTIQLNNPALLAELTGITVTADFRSRDIAAGGQGAPLAPSFHRAVFSDPGRHRAIINIGGIANVTSLVPDGMVIGFDTGPGNGLMDAWVAQHLHQPYDAGGAWAASGRVIAPLLKKLLAEPYFDQAPPKSTGRDLFNADWLAQRLNGNEAPADVQATLCALTASAIAEAVASLRQATQGKPDAFVCGGGAHNLHLMAALRSAAPDVAWGFTDELGVPADWVEAVAFAWFARQTMQNLSGNIPAVTGARGARVLGAVYPA
jgi:anhydro-N-acetylmuramic acid kinase